MAIGWVFRLEVVSKESPFTKDMVFVIKKRLLASPIIDKVLIEELNEEIKLFKKKEE